MDHVVLVVLVVFVIVYAQAVILKYIQISVCFSGVPHAIGS